MPLNNILPMESQVARIVLDKILLLWMRTNNNIFSEILYLFYALVSAGLFVGVIEILMNTGE